MLAGLTVEDDQNFSAITYNILAGITLLTISLC